MFSTRVISAAALVLVAGSAMAQQVTITSLLREGDPVSLSGATATSLGIPEANDVGGYVVALNAGTGISAFWGSATGGAGEVLRSEGTMGAYTQTGIEAFYGIANNGEIAYSPTCNGGPAPTTGADTVWQHDTPIAFQGLPVASMPGQFWSFASRPTTATETGEPWWVSGITSTAGGSTQNRGLFRGVDGTPVVLGGTVIPGAAEAISTSATSMFDFQISGSGNHFVGTFTFQGATTATDTCTVFDGAVMQVGGSPVREGTLVPASAGGNGAELWQNFGVYGVNNAGTVLIAGDTSAATTSDAFVFVGDHIVLREGDLVGGFPTTGSFTGADLNESGDWAVIWNVNDGAVREAIIFNGELLVREGDPIDFNGNGLPDDGVTLTDISASEVALGERINGSVDLYFVGDTSTVSGVGEALFRIRVTLPPTCGTSDYNGDGDFGTDADIEAFFACLAGNCCATCFPGGSDFNMDGDFGTDADIESFFRVLAGGPC